MRFNSTYLRILTYILIQVAKDHQLLLTARDFFQFVANFHEVISASATHIYHSALELSPFTSIVRKLYHHQQLHPSPRVVIGIEDSWAPTKDISSKDSYYLSSTWSPCGQFIAVMAMDAVVIRDSLTLKPLSTPQSTKAITRFNGGLAYSPDGHSLAGCSDSAIVIWDTQTGGEVTRVRCKSTNDGLELTWSKNGEVIATVSPWKSETITIHTYSIISGDTLFLGTLRSRDRPHVWAYEKSFQVLATTQDGGSRTFNIFKVGPTLTRVKSLPSHFDFHLRAFSPTTFRASVSHYNTNELYILDICNSEVLLREKQHYSGGAFSPDASFFAAFGFAVDLSIWKYCSGHYVQWREFQQMSASLQFSPTSLSILSTSFSTVHILHLDYFPAALAIASVKPAQSRLIDAFSPNSTYIATAHQGESTITITNLKSQNPFPSQFIDTELKISTMALMGNVLVVKSPDKIVAWLLMEGGMVDGVIGNPRADCNDSLWELSMPTLATRVAKFLRGRSVDESSLRFSVMDDIAIIRLHDLKMHTFHTRTGEVIKGGDITHPYDCASYRFYNEKHVDECNIYHNSLCMQQGTTTGNWLVSQATLQEGWVRDPEGKHRFWLPPRWRQSKDHVNWLHSATTLRLKSDHDLVIIKF